MTSDLRHLDVVTAGEAMALFAAGTPGALETVDAFTRSLAGAEMNVAIGLARLGLRVGYLAALGDDSFGRRIAATLRREGVWRQPEGFDQGRPTGFVLKSRQDDGSDPDIEYFRRGSAASYLGPEDLPIGWLATARHLHLTGIYVAVSPSTQALVFEMVRQARAAGCTISFDPNLRPALWPSTGEMIACMNRLASASDWVMPGLAEGQLLTGLETPQDIARAYRERGARGVVVKLGADGAWFDSDAGAGLAAGRRVEHVVDTVGAGDGFAVGVISGLLEGLSLASAAARGNVIGARVVQFPGDSEGLPTRAQLNQEERMTA